ncbi:terminase TerL endonuclease subunit [Hoeflea sp.]|uniref:terminase large subunit n=1 Tax=Hoeflea sp. TaxID=1940281 RepID=UPI0019A3097B|nr:terminase TerL endonuclease subunit [Hoeflea sp.]MBC7285457.1 terminase large subunit [Hoeflea sp.]
MAKRTRRQNTSHDPATAYAQNVVSGGIIAGPHVRASCERHLRDLDEAGNRGLVWDKKAAARALGFFPDVLRLSEGQFEGQPFQLHPAQEFIVGAIFGWKRADGTRRFRRAYIEQGKGNGKSPLAGGIGLYGLVADGEPGAQIFAAAAKMDQARILFNDAVAMVRQSPALEQRLTPTGINPVNNLAWMENGSFFRPVGRDTGKTGSGMRPHFVMIDELHEHPNRDTLEMLERGFKFRRNPLVFMITNSGSDRNSVCWEEHEHAVNVAHGEVEDDTTFSYICALDDDDDPLDDPSCWIKANPLLGVTITESYLADVAAQAKAIPGKANGIRRLHFCQWTDAETAWISRELWEACEDPDMKLDEFEGQECWFGLDLGATKDMTARVQIFRDGKTESGDPKFAMFAHGYTPADTLHGRVRDDRAPYDVWVDHGHLTATPGKVVRFDRVAADLVDMAARFEVVAVAYDRWLIRNFEITLDEMGVTLPLIEHPQGTNRRKDSPLWMPDSINEFEKLLLEGRLRIAVNPALRSAVASSTFWMSPAGLRRFEKQRAMARIDLAVAAAMAVGAAVANESDEPSVYEERGLLFV